ncbi:MAG: hypothetical protein HQ555_07785 [Candidatus Aminicenantes bacterium]|nr:hypothetical protein [Candidatus Aminicenantes bacterium]
MKSFKFSVDSYEKAREKLRDHFETTEELQKKIDSNNFHVLRILTWGVLLPQRPGLTLEKAGDYLKEVFQDGKRLKRLKIIIDRALLFIEKDIDKAIRKNEEAKRLLEI